MTFRVTYEMITEESAADGDVADRGYYSRGGWEHPDPSEWTLHGVISEFGRGCMEDSGHWFSTVDPRTDRDYFEQGESRYYSVHPPENITASSYARIRRILCGRGR